MIDFIIINNDKKLTEKIKNNISKIVFSYDIDYKILTFNKSNKEIDKTINDLSNIKIYIIDEDTLIAQRIRCIDWDSFIIILKDNIKVNNNYNIINIFSIIEKNSKLNSRLNKDLKMIITHKFDKNIFNYYSCSNHLQIYNKSINYIKRDTNLRKLIIYTNYKEYEINISIKDILKKLDKRFIQVSKSTIVNMDNISEINWNKGYFILLDGSIIYNASKKYKNNDY